MEIIHTDGRNPDFIRLCRLLDENLDEIVGGAIQREKYVQYNQLDDIHDAVVIYIDGDAAAGGSYKHYADSVAEIKRVFVKKEYRGRGLSKVLMKELETKAGEAGYGTLILETGEPLNASLGLYKSIGFTVIENYGQYKEMPESICMEKVLNEGKRSIN